MNGTYSTQIYANHAISLLDGWANAKIDKFFMYLAFQAIHSPDEVPQSYQDKFIETIPDTDDDSAGCGPGMLKPGEKCSVGRHRRIVAGMIAAVRVGCAIGSVRRAPLVHVRASTLACRTGVPYYLGLAQLDEGIGNITAAAKKNGLADSITYVFTTDNGGPAQGFNGNMVRALCAMQHLQHGCDRFDWKIHCTDLHE
jgi:arylsulfatase A-like enzyme